MRQRLVSKARLAIAPLAVLLAGCETEGTPSAPEPDPLSEERAAGASSDFDGLYTSGAACTEPGSQELRVPLAEPEQTLGDAPPWMEPVPGE